MAVERKPLYLNSDGYFNFIAPMAILGFLTSVWFVQFGRMAAPDAYAGLAKAIGALWVLGPPLWMWYEHYHYFPRHGNPEVGYEGLKNYHKVLTRLWFAAMIVIAALFLQLWPK